MNNIREILEKEPEERTEEEEQILNDIRTVKYKVPDSEYKEVYNTKVVYKAFTGEYEADIYDKEYSKPYRDSDGCVCENDDRYFL